MCVYVRRKDPSVHFFQEKNTFKVVQWSESAVSLEVVRDLQMTTIHPVQEFLSFRF